MSTILARWVPKRERAFLGAFAMSGSHVGSITGNSITGYVTHIFDNWKVAFYVWSFGMVFFVLFLFVWVFSFPTDSPFITEGELKMLSESIRTFNLYPGCF